jgi:hypothetical protein
MDPHAKDTQVAITAAAHVTDMPHHHTASLPEYRIFNHSRSFIEGSVGASTPKIICSSVNINEHSLPADTSLPIQNEGKKASNDIILKARTLLTVRGSLIKREEHKLPFPSIIATEYTWAISCHTRGRGWPSPDNTTASSLLPHPILIISIRKPHTPGVAGASKTLWIPLAFLRRGKEKKIILKITRKKVRCLR